MKKKALIATIKDMISDCKGVCQALWFLLKCAAALSAILLAGMAAIGVCILIIYFLIKAFPYVVREGSMLMQKYGDYVRGLLVILMTGYLIRTIFLYIRSAYRRNLKKFMEEADEEDKPKHED